MRSIQAPLLVAMGCIVQTLPNQVGNFAHAVPKSVGNLAHAVPKKFGNIAQTVPSSFGNSDGQSNEFDCPRHCRCAVLFTILFGGIVFGIIAMQTPKVKPAETKEEIPEEECPPSTTPTTVYRTSGRSLDMHKKKTDVSTQISPWLQTSPLIILTTADPYINSKKKKKKKKRPCPEGPSGDDQAMSTNEDIRPSSTETTDTDPRTSEPPKSESSKERIPAREKSICEICTKEPVTCICEKVHTKDKKHTCVTPHKKKTRRKKPSQTDSARRPSENRLITRVRSRRDSRRRSRTSDDPRLSRGSPSGANTSSRSRPRSKTKAKKS